MNQEEDQQEEQEQANVDRVSYDPGSSGALAYRAAAYELNSRPAP